MTKLQLIICEAERAGKIDIITRNNMLDIMEAARYKEKQDEYKKEYKKELLGEISIEERETLLNRLINLLVDGSNPNTKKLFISQPMKDKSNEVIKQERDHAIETVKSIIGEDIEVLDTFYDDMPENTKPLEYLARSINDLAKADIAYFVNGWQDYRGCKIEYMCATQYGIKVIDGRNN